ncbi:MAG: hypothetical protein GVY07_01530 [Bacteroidetes bacterium]|jgi:hypothetical protein|nr:hypothetical protein [Bacteroidota bacterium]
MYFKLFFKHIIIYVLFYFLIFYSSCSSGSSDEDFFESDIISESLEEIKNIQNSEAEKSNRPLISAVSDAMTDQDGNIYLADPRTFTLHSFSSDMTHRWTAGGRGRGPGTFMRISSVSIINEQLYVYDSATSRMTTYNLKGEKQAEWSYDEAGYNIGRIHSLGDDTRIAPGWDDSNETLVHIFNGTMRLRQKSLVDAADHYSTDYPHIEKQILTNEAGSVLPLSDSEFLYAPFLYSGEMYIYETSADSEWGVSDTVDGYDDINPPVELHFTDDGNFEGSHLSGVNREGGYFHAVYRSISHGLFMLENHQIAHISTRFSEDGRWDLVVEYVYPDQNVESEYKIVERFVPSQQLNRIPLWIDRSGNIYVSENSDTPLRVFTIDRENQGVGE